MKGQTGEQMGEMVMNLLLLVGIMNAHTLTCIPCFRFYVFLLSCIYAFIIITNNHYL